MMGDHVGEKCYKAYAKKQGICGGCPVALTFKDGKVHTLQRELQADEGTRYAEITASPLKDSKGNIIAGIEVVRDITNSKQVERDLKKSENILSSSFTALDGLLVVIDRDYRVILSNWKDHDFVPKEKRQGYPYCYEIFKNRETPCGYCPPKDTFADGKFRVYEDRNPVDGSYKEISVSSVFDDTGDVVFVVEHVRDITERKQAEESLKVSEAKFKSLAEESPNMIFINYKGRVVYVNGPCEEMMGYTKDEFYSEEFDFRKLIAPEYLELISSAFQKHIQGEEVIPYEYALVTKNGRKIEVIITTKLIKYENDKAILGIITDITERIKNEAVIKKSEQELNKRVKELEEFMRDSRKRMGMIELKKEMEGLKKKLAKYEKK